MNGRLLDQLHELAHRFPGYVYCRITAQLSQEGVAVISTIEFHD